MFHRRTGVAPSNVKPASSVPLTLCTVTHTCAVAIPEAWATKHRTAVPLAHAAVAQLALLSAAVGVGSIRAKARPVMVPGRPPEAGTLPLPTDTKETAGAEGKQAKVIFDDGRGKRGRELVHVHKVYSILRMQ